MTQREFMEAVIAVDGMTEELVAYATDAIAKLDETNAKRKAKAAEKKAETSAEDAELMEKIVGYLNADVALVATDILDKLMADGVEVLANGKALTRQKVSRLAGALVEAGKAVKVEVKGTSKQGKRVGYKLA